MASELLKVGLHPTCSNTEVKLIDGASGKTCTVLSVTICETGGAAETFNLLIDDGGGGADTHIYHTQALGANETFEHTGKIVMTAASHLSIATGDSSNIDVCVSYLEQTL